MFVILNIETGDYYSESPTLKNKAKQTGTPWNNSSTHLAFARPYERFKDAVRRSQKISDLHGCVCSVLHLT